MAQLLEIEESHLEDLAQYANGFRLYAIIDACDAPSIPGKMEALGEQHAVSLYRGMAEEDFSAFAPYLARVDGELLAWLKANLWNEPWGIFLISSAPLAELRSHFRRFLIVDDPKQKEMYFRFYDPRVLRKFLPVCNAPELREFFGPVEQYRVAAGDPIQTMTLSRLVRDLPAPVGARRIGQRFVVRAEIMAAFGDETDAAFEQRLIEHLRDHHSRRVGGMSADLMLPIIRTGISRARRYGITGEANVTAYVALMFEIAPDFDRHPRMQMILSSRQIVPDNKMDVLMERTEDSTWQDVRKRSDPRAWVEPGMEYA